MELLNSLWNVLVALVDFLVALGQVIVPWLPLIAWVAFWLFAVNWRHLYPVLMRGGLVGVALIAVAAILVWSSVASDAGHHLYGLHVSSVMGKAVYVTALAVIAMLCGSVQLSGFCGRLCPVEEPPVVDEGHQHH